MMLLFSQHGAIQYPVRLNSGNQAILSPRKRTRFSIFRKDTLLLTQGNLLLECTTKAHKQSKKSLHQPTNTIENKS
jgi:hypothetical protein